VTGVPAAIEARFSCRTFDGRPLSGDERRRVEELLAGPHGSPFGSRLRFALLDTVPTGGTAPARLGTWGIIRGAPSFVGGAVAIGPGAYEDYGFALERIVLGLTGMGLGTCWLAGTLRREQFEARLRLSAGETLPAVTPVGHRAVRPSLTDSVMRFGARSARRRPWEDLFGVSRQDAGPWGSCLEAVRLAPSATNAQPWRVVMQAAPPVFHLGLAGPASPASHRRLDAGIAMCHFSLAAAHIGRPGSWVAPGAIPLRRSLPPGVVHVASWIPA
jgi:hypothetical protein